MGEKTAGGRKEMRPKGVQSTIMDKKKAKVDFDVSLSTFFNNEEYNSASKDVLRQPLEEQKKNSLLEILDGTYPLESFSKLLEIGSFPYSSLPIFTDSYLLGKFKVRGSATDNIKNKSTNIVAIMKISEDFSVEIDTSSDSSKISSKFTNLFGTISFPKISRNKNRPIIGAEIYLKESKFHFSGVFVLQQVPNEGEFSHILKGVYYRNNVEITEETTPIGSWWMEFSKIQDTNNNNNIDITTEGKLKTVQYNSAGALFNNNNNEEKEKEKEKISKSFSAIQRSSPLYSSQVSNANDCKSSVLKHSLLDYFFSNEMKEYVQQLMQTIQRNKLEETKLFENSRIQKFFIAIYLDDLIMAEESLTLYFNEHHDLSISLSQCISLSYPDYFEYPIFIAIKNKSLEMMDLLENKLSIHSSYSDTLTPIVLTILENFDEGFDYLTRSNFDINFPAKNERYPLTVAMETLNIPFLTKLIKLNVDLKPVIDMGFEELSIYCISGGIDIVKLQLDNGQSIFKLTKVNNIYFSPIIYTILLNHQHLFNYFIDRNLLNINNIINDADISKSAILAINTAISIGNIELFSKMIERFGYQFTIIEKSITTEIQDINEENRSITYSKNSQIIINNEHSIILHPIVIILQNNQNEILSEFLKLKLDINSEFLCNYRNQFYHLSPLKIAILLRNRDAVEQLINSNLMTNITSSNPSPSPLRLAFYLKDISIINLLLSSNSDIYNSESPNQDINANNNNNNSAIGSSDEIIDKLLKGDYPPYYISLFQLSLHPSIDLPIEIVSRVYDSNAPQLFPILSLFNGAPEDFNFMNLLNLLEKDESLDLFSPVNENNPISEKTIIDFIYHLTFRPKLKGLIANTLKYSVDNNYKIYQKVIAKLISHNAIEQYKLFIDISSDFLDFNPQSGQIDLLCCAIISGNIEIFDLTLTYYLPEYYLNNSNPFKELFELKSLSIANNRMLRSLIKKFPKSPTYLSYLIYHLIQINKFKLINMLLNLSDLDISSKYMDYNFIFLLMEKKNCQEVLYSFLSNILNNNNQSKDIYTKLINEQCGVKGRTAVHLASKYASFEMFELILKFGANVLEPLDVDNCHPFIYISENRELYTKYMQFEEKVHSIKFEDLHIYINYLHTKPDRFVDYTTTSGTELQTIFPHRYLRVHRYESIISYAINQELFDFLEYIMETSPKIYLHEITTPIVFKKYKDEGLIFGDNWSYYDRNNPLGGEKSSKKERETEEKHVFFTQTIFDLIFTKLYEFLAPRSSKEKRDDHWERCQRFVNLAISILEIENINYETIMKISVGNKSTFKSLIICSHILMKEVPSYFTQLCTNVLLKFTEYPRLTDHISQYVFPLDKFKLSMTELLSSHLSIRWSEIPQSIVKNNSALEYFFDLAAGRQKTKKLRVIIVGPAAAGKTTIVKNFVGEKWMGSELNHFEEVEKGNTTEIQKKKTRKNVTDGIDVHQWVPADSDVEITLWDFAGQEIYYTTHQFFISNGALYLIVFNICKPLREARILYWLNSIQSRAEGQQVLIVATHVDKIKTQKERDDMLQEISKGIELVYKQWSRNFSTSENIVSIIPNKKDKLILWPVGLKIKENLMDVKEAIKANALTKETVPNSYVSLLQKINKGRLQYSPPIAELSIIHKWAESEERGYKLKDDSLKRALHLFHEWGEILYFDSKDTTSWHLTNKVCLNPKWLSEVFKTVSSFKHISTSGSYQPLITKDELEERWVEAQFPNSIFPYLIELLEQQYQIIVRLPDYKHKTPTYLIPSLLPETSHSLFWIPLHNIYDDPKRKKNSSSSSNLLSNNDNNGSSGNLARSINNNSNNAINYTNSDAIVSTNIEYYREYHLTFMPHGLFSRLLVHLLLLEKDANIRIVDYWKNGIIIHSLLDNVIAQVKIIEDGRNVFGRIIVITVRSMDKNWRSMMVRIHFLIIDMITNWYSGLRNRMEIRVGINSLESGITIEECYETLANRYINSVEQSSLSEFHDLLPELSLPLISWKSGQFEDRDLTSSQEQFDRDVLINKETDKLGSGMFGNVYKAYFNQQIVAVKMLSEDNPTKDDVIDFCKEIGMLSSLSHPNIIKLLYFFPKPMAIVTEFIKGGDLQSVVLKQVKLDWLTVAKVIYDIAVGLEYMHSLNPPILHCDLKPANILVVDIHAKSPNISVKIADIGCARMANNKGQSGNDNMETELVGYFSIVKDLYSLGELFSPCPQTMKVLYENIEKKLISAPIFQSISKQLKSILKMKSDLHNVTYFDNLQFIQTIKSFHQSGRKKELFSAISSQREKGIPFSKKIKKVIFAILHQAIAEGDLEFFAENLRNSNVEINESIYVEKSSATKLIHLSCKYGKQNVLNYLLANGANSSFLNKKGMNSLYIAIEYDQPQIISILLENNLQLIDSILLSSGHSPYTFAIEKGFIDCMIELTRYKINISIGVSSLALSMPSKIPIKVSLAIADDQIKKNCCKYLLENGIRYCNQITEEEIVFLSDLIFDMFFEVISLNGQIARDILCNLQIFLPSFPSERLISISKNIMLKMMKTYPISRITKFLSSSQKYLCLEPTEIILSFDNINQTISTSVTYKNNYRITQSGSLFIPQSKHLIVDDITEPTFKILPLLSKLINFSVTLISFKAGQNSFNFPIILKIESNLQLQYFLFPLVITLNNIKN